MELTVLCKVMNARVAGTWWIRNGPEIQPLNEQRDQAKLLGISLETQPSLVGFFGSKQQKLTLASQVVQW